MPVRLFVWVSPSIAAQEDYDNTVTSIDAPGKKCLSRSLFSSSLVMFFSFPLEFESLTGGIARCKGRCKGSPAALRFFFDSPAADPQMVVNACTFVCAGAPLVAAQEHNNNSIEAQEDYDDSIMAQDDYDDALGSVDAPGQNVGPWH